MKNIISLLIGSVFVSGSLFLTTSCDDFFETNPANIMNDEDYMGKESDIYRGYLGIQTRMQEVGDQAMILTDTRCQYLETTGNAPVALQNINNYEPTDGNTYADPTGYYAVVVACNDFLTKIDDFYTEVNGVVSDSAKVRIPRLVSGALRYKVWAYLMLGRIYGEAYWYDTSNTELVSLSDTKTFEHLDMKGICDKCIDLLDNGITLCGQQIPADLTMDWTRWVEPLVGDANYDYWKYMSPDWLCLRAELTTWRTNYEDAAAAKADWQWVRDNVLQFLYDQTNLKWYNYATCMTLTLYYAQMFYGEGAVEDNIYTGSGDGHLQTLSAIYYDYDNFQRNRIVQYLCPEYPGDGYYLRPSEYAMSQYNSSDLRGETQKLMVTRYNEGLALTKFYYTRYNSRGYLRTKIFEIEPQIYLYRGHELHYWLAEAENHLGHWQVCDALLNDGVLNYFPGGVNTLPKDSIDGDRMWDERYSSFFAASGGYGDLGLTGTVKGALHDLTQLPDGGDTLAFAFDEDRIKEYDLALADEFLKEFTGEGKSYSYLCKMAERYGKDYTVIYDRIKGKYENSGNQQKVQSSLQQKYFIDWNL